MSETSPTLGLPMVDARCGHPECKGKDGYRMVGVCLNCGTRSVGLFTSGHGTREGRAKCPACGVCTFGGIAWHGLEDAASS